MLDRVLHTKSYIKFNILFQEGEKTQLLHVIDAPRKKVLLPAGCLKADIESRFPKTTLSSVINENAPVRGYDGILPYSELP